MGDAVARRGEISLGGWRFRLLEGTEPRYVEVARQLPRMVTGEPSEAEETEAAAWIIGDPSGGLLVREMDPMSQQDRSWFAIAETMRSRYTGPPPYAHDCGNAGLDGVHCNELIQYADEVYAVLGQQVRKWNEATGSWGSNLHTLPGLPTAWAIYQNVLYIACGDAGYTSFDGATWTDVAGSTEKAQAFCVWDGKLFKVDSLGAVKYSTDGSSWTGAVTLDYPAGSYQSLFPYVNGAGDSCVYVAHKYGFDWIDFGNGKAFQSGLVLPRHPRGGRAARVWRGDVAIYPAGLSMYAYSPGNVRAVGLDREDGVPASMRGEIVDIEGGHYALWAALDNTEAAAPTVTAFSSTPIRSVRPKVVNEAVGFSYLLAWNGTGWHAWWESGEQDKGIKCLLLSDAYNDYRLWFGASGRVWYIRLPQGVYNPKDNPKSEYAAYWQRVTPWFNGGLATQQKTGLRLELHTEGVKPTNTMTVSYGLDGSESWTQIGQYSADDPAAYRFGGGAGLAFRRIRFKFEGQRAVGEDISDACWLIAAKFYYKRSLPKLAGWELRLDCREEFGGHSPKQQVERLKMLADPADRLMVPYTYKVTGETYYVEVAIQGEEISGNEDGGVFVVRVKEVA